MQNISNAEDALMTTFEMLAYVPLSLTVTGSIIWFGLEKHHEDTRLFMTLELSRRRFVERATPARLRVGCLLAVPLLACGLLWTILRVQHFQQHMTTANGGGDSDAQWTFGQVVAVTVFAPIIVESWATFRAASWSSAGGET